MNERPLNPLPLTVLAGYLGAGKTTALNRMLAEAGGRRIMVLVNDFGDIAIDEELIAAREGDTISLSNGCVCCAVGSDLFRAFAKALDARPRPDHLVIEASGVAEPDRIANFARAEPDLRLDAIIVFADAVNALEQASDPLIGETLMRQFKSAGLLAVTKQDLVSAKELEGLEKFLKECAPGAPIVVGTPTLDVMLGSKSAAFEPSEEVYGHSHEDIYERWSFSSNQALGKEEVAALLRELPKGVLRLKGISSGPAGNFAFHAAGRHHEVGPITNTSEPGLHAVAIGLKKKLPAKALDALFKRFSAVPLVDG